LDSVKSMLTGGRVDVRGRYEFETEAISGTMSKFHKARDKRTGAIVGLKILDPKKTAEFEGRFKGADKPSEAEILKAISHPNVVRLLQYGKTFEGEPFIIMEFIEGKPLNFLIRERNKALEGRRLPLIRQAAEGLRAVHLAGYIHRDVCPRNFMASPDLKTVKLIDFGLTVPATPLFMQPGNRTGTPNYMAPELVKRMATDQRLDVFAFGVSVYELCAFELPWERGNTGQVAMTHSARPPADIRKYRPQIHPILARAITACIEQDVNKRCPSIDDFLQMIRDVKSEDAG
jgi:serine/threonine-protein kinase